MKDKGADEKNCLKNQFPCIKELGWILVSVCFNKLQIWFGAFYLISKSAMPNTSPNCRQTALSRQRSV